MMQIATGLLLGIAASLIAGLILTWKGEQLVGYLRRLPEQRRISLFTKAYIIGLRSYPYRFVHAQALITFGMFNFIAAVGYAIITASYFYQSYSGSSDPVLAPEAIREATGIAAPYMPWVLLAFTCSFWYLCIRIFFRRIMPETLAPYGYHELMRVHDCVAKFGTKKQYLDYINAAHNVKDNESLVHLLDVAQAAIGDSKYELLDRIRAGITPGEGK